MTCRETAMMFFSGAGLAPRPRNKRLQRALRAGAIVSASVVPGAALAADFVYWGDNTYSQAFGAGRLLTDAMSTEMSRFTESADGVAALPYADDARMKTNAFKD